MLGRVIAVLVMIASAGIIAWHHRTDLMPAPAVPIDPAEAAYQACITERGAGIDKMRTEGTINDDQATLFKSRADALCRSQAGS
ncbi:MAG: hypothetical protein P1V34_04325 [Alphaproteobacteria bacterium]|nr:hypothetical protein [Alphaproteobacteria bacterium]